MKKRIEELEALVKSLQELVGAQAKLIAQLQVGPTQPIVQPLLPVAPVPSLPQPHTPPWYGPYIVTCTDGTQLDSQVIENRMISCWPTTPPIEQNSGAW